MQIETFEAMRVARDAKEMFARLEVWHPTSADIKDPVLVGCNGDRYSTSEFFILARWGEVLLPLAEMIPMAAAMVRAKYTVKLKAMLLDIDRELRTLTDTPDSVLAEARVQDPSYHGVMREY